MHFVRKPNLAKALIVALNPECLDHGPTHLNHCPKLALGWSEVSQLFLPKQFSAISIFASHIPKAQLYKLHCLLIVLRFCRRILQRPPFSGIIGMVMLTRSTSAQLTLKASPLLVADSFEN